MMRQLLFGIKTLALFLMTTLIFTDRLNYSENQLQAEFVTTQIKNEIKTLKLLPEAQLTKLARSIYQSSQAHQIDYKIMTAIMMVESGFSQSVISSTGDISIVQINYKIWAKESKRLKMELSESRLKQDPDYAIMKLGEILKYLKQRYAKHDPHWYGRYHSRTLAFKRSYVTKLMTQGYRAQSLASVSRSLD